MHFLMHIEVVDGFECRAANLTRKRTRIIMTRLMILHFRLGQELLRTEGTSVKCWGSVETTTMLPETGVIDGGVVTLRAFQ